MESDGVTITKFNFTKGAEETQVEFNARVIAGLLEATRAGELAPPVAAAAVADLLLEDVNGNRE